MTQPTKMQRTTWQLIGVTVILLLLGSMSFLKANDTPEIIAVINGHKITRDTFYDTLEQYNVDGEPLGQIVLRQLISEALVDQANNTFELGVDEEAVEAEFTRIRDYYGDEFQTLLDQIGLTEERLRHELRFGLIMEELLVKDVEVTNEDVRAFYDENKEFFFQPELFRASQILVQTEDEADEILEQLAAGANFDELREEKSMDKSNWGLISQYDAIPDAIGEILFALQVGEVSPPVAAHDGYYLIRLEEIVPARDQTYEEVAEEIREHLTYTQAASVDEALAALWKGAQLSVNLERYQGLEENTK